MITMDFDTFIENFHKRLAQRLTEFDKALTEAQKTVDAAREKQKEAQSQPQSSRHPLMGTAPKATPPASRQRGGAVQGVLRKN